MKLCAIKQYPPVVLKCCKGNDSYTNEKDIDKIYLKFGDFISRDR